jgi:putative endopeptidase
MKQLLAAMIVSGAAVLTLAASAQTATEADKPLPPVFDPAAIDHSFEPCNDFYQYACGAWLKANPIPKDQSEWWRFSELDEHIRAVLASILDDAAAGKGADSESVRKIGDYYASCLDEAAIEAKGLAPFAPELDRIAALKDKKELAGEVARLHLLGAAPLFYFSSTQDYTDAAMMIAEADQDGFALPDRDYYLTGEYKSERADYRLHLSRMFKLLGDRAQRAKAEADAAMRVETALAKAAMGVVERREPKNIHHKMTLEEFVRLTPSFDWTVYLAAIGAPSFASLDVADPGFFKGLEPALKSIPLDDWKSYLRWTYIDALVSSAPKAFVDEDFAFFGKLLDGQEEIEARWKRCVDATDDQLGDALGEAYVARAFSPEAKARVLAMMHEVVKAMEADIKTLDWMSEETKARALDKLAKVAFKVGYPDTWIDYAKLEIIRGDALGNDARASGFDFRRELAKIGKPVDRTEWAMTASTDNAYYDAQLNDINFPAGVLQPPNFAMAADDAANYGNLAFLIGHELTHGFDDEGRHYDGAGNLKDWWSAQDAASFETRAGAFVGEYDKFIAVKHSSNPRKDVHIDGKLTLGENTADNGGIRLAYNAFLATASAKEGKDGLGYTPAQRFFLSYAQGWCHNRTDAFARTDAKTNPHAPGKYRVNGVLVNMEPFREAFSCKVGAPMAPATINRVW